MHIDYQIGDMIRGGEKYLLHGCNAQGVMGSGVARALRDEWPQVFTEYRQVYDDKGLQLGDVIPVRVKVGEVFGEPDYRLVFNCITQNQYGRDGTRYANYGAISTCIWKVNRFMLERAPRHRVAMPMIGAGLGGGDWMLISQIIEREAVDFTPVVYDLTP